MEKQQILTAEQHAYLQKCAETAGQLAQLLPELESGKATEAQTAAALEAAQFLQNASDNCAFLARCIVGKLDPVTPGNIWEKVYHAQPHYFESDRPQPIQTKPGGIPASRW